MVDFDPTKEFATFQRELGSSLRQCEAHQLPFLELCSSLEFQRGDWEPLVQVAMNLMPATQPIKLKDHSEGKPDGFLSGVMDKFAKFEISVEWIEEKGFIRKGTIAVRKEVYSKTFSEAFTSAYGTVLRKIVENPLKTPLGKLQLLSNLDLRKVQSFSSCNFLSTPSQPSFFCVGKAFVDVCQRFPNNVAISHRKEELIYSELDLLSNGVAYKLSEMKIETKWDQGQPVGIYLAQGISFIVAALGVVKAGGCYVPFDPAIHNVTQISPMVSDSKLSVVITDCNYCHKFTHQWPELGLVIVDNLKRHAEHPLIKFSNPNNIPFHILYTSGTSGRQKGVQITH